MVTTDTQHLGKLRPYWEQLHAFPAKAKLCDVVGMAFAASVLDLVTRLKQAGYVQRIESLRRRVVGRTHHTRLPSNKFDRLMQGEQAATELQMHFRRRLVLLSRGAY